MSEESNTLLMSSTITPHKIESRHRVHETLQRHFA